MNAALIPPYERYPESESDGVRVPALEKTPTDGPLGVTPGDEWPMRLPL
jgi:hypothetical protein